jgi:hypothetical protein
MSCSGMRESSNAYSEFRAEAHRWSGQTAWSAGVQSQHSAWVSARKFSNQLSPGAADVQKALAKIPLGIEKHLRSRIEQDNVTSRPDRMVDAAAMAGYITAVIQGMSTLARDGAARTKLLAIADTAMQAWPV